MSETPAKRHLGRIAQLACVLCRRLGRGDTQPVHCHHPRFSAGMGRKNSDYLAIPLCPDCHQGTDGVHGSRALLRIAKVEELDLLADTVAALTRFLTGGVG